MRELSKDHVSLNCYESSCEISLVSLSLSLSLFRLLSAYLLPFLLSLFKIISKTLKCVLSMSTFNLNFFLTGILKKGRMPSTMKVIARILSDQRSKYSIVGTKTQKNE